MSSPTKVSAGLTSGVIKTTEKVSKTASFGSSANSGKVIQLDTSGLIPPNLLNPVADQFRLNADQAITASEVDLTAWERVDTAGQGTTTSQLTQSSGIFSFPSTGLYLVMFHASIGRTAANVDIIDLRLRGSTDNFTGNNLLVESSAGITGSTPSEIAPLVTLLNVTNTTNDKLKITVEADATGTTLRGSSATNKTYITFLRITGT
tara:strand:- start:517 stop:1134 length:618 start_codon:yes stop_codon:yes gene_type:complete